MSGFEDVRPAARPSRPGPRGLDTRPFLTRIGRDHPGLLITAIYLILTAIGMCYDAWLYARFRINIFHYAQTGDFLLSAVRTPIVVLLSLLPIPISMLLARLNTWLRVRHPAVYRSLGGSAWDRSPSLNAGMWILFVIIYASLFTQLYAAAVARDVKAGKGRRVEVTLQSGAPARLDHVIVIGTTSRFVFLHAPEERRTHIVPVENISRIVVPLVRPDSLGGPASR